MRPFCDTSHYFKVKSLLTLQRIFELIPNLMPLTALLWPWRVPIQFLALTSQSLMRVSYPAVAMILSLEVCKAIQRISALWCSSSFPKEMKSFFPVYLSHLIIDRSLLHEKMEVGVAYIAVMVWRWPLYSIGYSISMSVNCSVKDSYNLFCFLSWNIKKNTCYSLSCWITSSSIVSYFYLL